MTPITYTSDQLHDYVTALHGCKTPAQLTELLNSFHVIADDALEAAPKDEVEFAEFRAGLLKERKGVFAGEEFAERYGSVLMPELMFKVGMIASKFGAPWGLAFLRLKEAGQIVFDDGGIARLSQP